VRKCAGHLLAVPDRAALAKPGFVAGEAKATRDRVRMHRMKARSKAAAGGMDIDFGDAMYNDGIDIGDPDVPMMEGDPTDKVWAPCRRRLRGRETS
jgi:hypothetical protein